MKKKIDVRLKALGVFTALTILFNLIGFFLARMQGYFNWKDGYGAVFVPLIFLFPVYLLFFAPLNRTWIYALGFFLMSSFLYYRMDDMCKGDFVYAMLTGMFQLSMQIIMLIHKVVQDERWYIIAIVFVQTFGTFLFSRMIINRLEKRSA